MKFPHLVLCAFGALSLSSAEIPAPRPMPPFDFGKNAPPIPDIPPVETPHPSPILLWPEGAPGTSRAHRDEPENIAWLRDPEMVFPVIYNIHQPSLTPFLPSKELATGCAVIIAPGGGHQFLTIDREGYDVARFLASRGIAGFVLKHRLARDLTNPRGTPQPYSVETHTAADVSRAIRLLRSRATEFGLKPDRIGVMGFSAGGQVALLAAKNSTPGTPASPDPLERVSSRPDFIAPIYPGGLQGGNYDWLSPETPPTFLLCASDDRMPEQVAAFYSAMHRAGANVEVHIYSKGGHGFGMRTDRPELGVSSWHLRLVEWLADREFLN